MQRRTIVFFPIKTVELSRIAARICMNCLDPTLSACTRKHLVCVSIKWHSFLSYCSIEHNISSEYCHRNALHQRMGPNSWNKGAAGEAAAHIPPSQSSTDPPCFTHHEIYIVQYNTMNIGVPPPWQQAWRRKASLLIGRQSLSFVCVTEKQDQTGSRPQGYLTCLNIIFF
jgi:hypothetical protein